DHQRAVIAEAFNCPVRETYGMDENVAAASECTGGRLHTWPEVGWMEVVANGRPVPPGTPGEFLGTSLLNRGMPLVRYRIGDHGQLADPAEGCACGAGGDPGARRRRGRANRREARLTPGARVLVLDGQTNQALACVRSLGRAGYRVLVASQRRWPLAAWSRYSRGGFRLPGQTVAAFARLRAWAERRRVDVVLPLTERACVLCN